MHITDNLSRKAAFHRFNLGNLALTVVSDGHILFDPKQPILAPDIDENKVNEVLEEFFLPTGYVNIAMNVLVIKSSTRTILIDAGAGYTMGERSGWLLNNLEIAGIYHNEITDVILTHAHSDHIGGLVKEDGELAFPNADVYLTAIEHDFWLSDNVDLSKSRLTDKKWFTDFTVEIIKRAKSALESKLHLVGTNAELFDFLKLIPAPGHTPGHVAIQISSNGEKLFHLGDSAHTHVILFEHPEWGFEADYDFEEGIATRTKLMSQLADERMRVFSFHLPFPGLGHIKRKATGFEWVAELFTSFNAQNFIP